MYSSRQVAILFTMSEKGNAMINRIFVSGATHGIGYQLVRSLAQNPANVLYTCASNREDPRGDRLREFTQFRYCDLARPKEIEAFFDFCCGDAPLNVAVNNAGTGCVPRPLHLSDEKAARRVLEVNFIGAYLCMKREIASMLEAGSGLIINVASIAAWKAGVGADPIYSASKAALCQLTKECAAEPRYRDKIRFVTVLPGWIETRMTAMDNKEKWASFLPSGRPGTPEEVARVIQCIIEHPQGYPSGTEIYLCGGGELV